MTNPERDPEPSSAAESGVDGAEPPAGGYETPAYGEPPSYPPPPPGFEQPQYPPPMSGYQQPQYPQPDYQQPQYPPPPPGYQPYGSYGSPYDAPAGYPPPPPGYPPLAGGFGAGRKTNALAIWSLVASLIGFVCCLGSVAGIALGLVSLNQIKQNQEEGQGLAIAGIAVGAVSLLAGLVMAVVLMGS